MKVPFSPPDMSELEVNEVCDAIRSGWITTGPRTKEFERKIADYCHTEKAVCLNSATACMQLATADTVYYQRERIGSAMRSKQPKLEVLKEHLYIEWKYITEWCKHPLMYNAAFVLSRIVACAKNCMRYLRN